MNEKWRVCSTGDPQWLQERKTCVTGTQLAALMGMGKFQTKEHVRARWNDGPWKMSRNLWWGRQMEAPNVTILAEVLQPVYQVDELSDFYRRGPIGASTDAVATRLVDDPSVDPWGYDNASLVSSASKRLQRQLAHLDAEAAVGQDFLVDLKNSDLPKKDWGPQPPEHYWCQMQAQMWATETRLSVLAAKVGAADMRLYVIERDDEFLAKAVKEADEFLGEMGLEAKPWT